MARKKSHDLHDETFAEGTVTDHGHQQRLDRYSRAKKHQLSLVDFIADDWDLRKEYTDMCKCGSLLTFKHWLKTGFRRLVAGFTCKKHLLCWPCGLRRSSGQVRDYSLKVHQVLTERPHLVPVLITLTVKNGSDLKERYDHISNNHRSLIDVRRDSLKKNTNTRGRRRNSVMQYVAGAVGTYEFKRGKNSGQWHPHIHQIALLEPVFEFTEEKVPCWKKDLNGKWSKGAKIIHVPREFVSLLAQEYWMASGDSYIVDAHRIDLGNPDDLLQPPSPADEPDQVSSAPNTLIRALCEVFKYALKFTELSHEDQVHAYKTLKGRRLLFSYGCLLGVKVDDNLVDPAREELEIGPYVYEMYRFLQGRYRFRCAVDGDAYDEAVDRNRQLMSARSRWREFLDEGFDIPTPIVLDEDWALNSGNILSGPVLDESIEDTPLEEIPF